MAWSKIIYKGKKPVGWWFHKIMCETAYALRGSGSWYYYHLDKMCNKYQINLYGKKLF